MDWKVFWPAKDFGGILALLAVLSIMCSRTFMHWIISHIAVAHSRNHGHLLFVELMVYIVVD
jgi:hypothetical protein